MSVTHTLLLQAYDSPTHDILIVKRKTSEPLDAAKSHSPARILIDYPVVVPVVVPVHTEEMEYSNMAAVVEGVVVPNTEPVAERMRSMEQT